MGFTLVEKIAARHADGLAPGTQVRSGDFVSIRPRHVMTHDNTDAVIPKFKQIGATAIADPAQPVFAIDQARGVRAYYRHCGAGRSNDLTVRPISKLTPVRRP